MHGMREAVMDAAAKGHQQLVAQVMSYISLMSDLKEKYGWTAAQYYWYELQKQVELGYHPMEQGSPFNPTVMFTLQGKYQPLAGRPAKGSGATATTPSAAT